MCDGFNNCDGEIDNPVRLGEECSLEVEVEPGELCAYPATYQCPVAPTRGVASELIWRALLLQSAVTEEMMTAMVSLMRGLRPSKSSVMASIIIAMVRWMRVGSAVSSSITIARSASVGRTHLSSISMHRWAIPRRDSLRLRCLSHVGCMTTSTLKTSPVIPPQRDRGSTWFTRRVVSARVSGSVSRGTVTSLTSPTRTDNQTSSSAS